MDGDDDDDEGIREINGTEDLYVKDSIGFTPSNKLRNSSLYNSIYDKYIEYESGSSDDSIVEKIVSNALGIIPFFSLFKIENIPIGDDKLDLILTEDPVIVYVLPDPVTPYAKTVELYPWIDALTNG